MTSVFGVQPDHNRNVAADQAANHALAAHDTYARQAIAGFQDPAPAPPLTNSAGTTAGGAGASRVGAGAGTGHADAASGAGLAPPMAEEKPQP